MTPLRTEVRPLGRVLLVAALVGIVLAVPATRALAESEHSNVEELTSLSIEDLLSIEVVSATKHAAPLAQTPAAVAVITREDIRASGATSLPELLRQALGVQAARLDSSRWAISTRGSNGLYANKLLVLVDGRSVYSDLFSGVFWAHLDLPLDDIDRIEVIRGPGGASWGANAVNGVINIITKKASESLGTRLSVAYGDTAPRSVITARHGIELGQRGHLRLSAKSSRRGRYESESGEETTEHSTDARLNARYDVERATGGHLSIIAEASRTEPTATITEVIPEAPFSFTRVAEGLIESQSLLVRWSRARPRDDAPPLQFQFSVTRNEHDAVFFRDEVTVYDFDVHAGTKLGSRHSLAYGGGIRHLDTELERTTDVRQIVGPREISHFNAFLEDTWTLHENGTVLNVGVKLEHNEYTGFEFQPTARLRFRTGEHGVAWAAVSRAVRTPSRVETSARVDLAVGMVGPSTIVFSALPNLDISSEELTALEFGYRAQLGERLSLDLTVFGHQYDNVIQLEPLPLVPDPEAPLDRLLAGITWVNGAEADAYGFEGSLRYLCGSHCSIDFSYSFLDSETSYPAGSSFTGGSPFAPDGLSPRHSLKLNARAKLSASVEASLFLRHSSRLEPSDLGTLAGLVYKPVDATTQADLALTWTPRKELQLRLVGQDLLDDRHLEFFDYSFGSRPNWVPRRVYLSATLSY